MDIFRKKYDFDIETITIDSGYSGTHLLVLGAVHGNEPCGAKAAVRIITECENKVRTLTSGKVTFVPVCNPRAFAQNVRETEENLNRVFYKIPRSDSYEAQLAPVLCAIIDECDVVLDVHSYRDKTAPFTLNDYKNETTDKWVADLFPKSSVEGWTELYPEGGGTLDYANDGGKVGLCVECGPHDDEKTAHNAYTIVDESIAFWNMGPKLTDAPKQRPLDIGHMIRLVHRPDETAQLVDGIQNFMPFTKGDILYTSSNEGNFCAPFDGFIMMPKFNAAPGKEWFYLACKNQSSSS